MDAIRIESTIPAEKIHHIIEEFPIKRDVNISYEEYGNRSRYIFSLNTKEILEDTIFLNTIIKFVEDLIISFYAEDIISEAIDKKLKQLDPANKLEIIEEVKDVLLSETLFMEEKKEINKELFDYLIEHDTLIVDGYLNFRSRPYHELIEKSIELVLGEFQLEVEYEEFIDMLRELIEKQSPEMDLLNIVIEDEKYILMDSNFKRLNNYYISNALEELYYNQVSDGDILLSTVIALSPRKLIVHLGNKVKDDNIFILEEIFVERLEICRSCEICKKL